MPKPLDWRGLLTEHGVRFVERGANVKRGEINIQCPFCGSADPSHHMGLNLEHGAWACWRNSDHRGKSPLRLLVKLLNISYGRARQLAGMDESMMDPDGFDAIAARVMGRDSRIVNPEHVRREFLSLPREFVPVREGGASSRFFAYLRGRGFDADGIEDLGAFYGVRAAISGAYKDRVVLPYYVDDQLVAWTARAIAPAEIRYKDLALDDCLLPIKETLFNYDALTQGRPHGCALLVVEGPMDALKIDCYGVDHGVRAVALSTNSMSEEQLYILEEFAPTFPRVFVMLDNASVLGVVDSMRMKQRLHGIPNLAIMPVPYGLKDAGEMTAFQARTFAHDLERSIRDGSV